LPDKIGIAKTLLQSMYDCLACSLIVGPDAIGVCIGAMGRNIEAPARQPELR
jgi:hypothetical protein